MIRRNHPSSGHSDAHVVRRAKTQRAGHSQNYQRARLTVRSCVVVSAVAMASRRDDAAAADWDECCPAVTQILAGNSLKDGNF